MTTKISFLKTADSINSMLYLFLKNARNMYIFFIGTHISGKDLKNLVIVFDSGQMSWTDEETG